VRAGSPEQQEDYELTRVLDADSTCFCHAGLPVVAGRYTPALELTNGVPIGALVCAGWFDWMATGALPARPHRRLTITPSTKPVAPRRDTR